MDDLIRKYSEELQKTQRERNELKHQLAEKDIVIEVLQRDISNLQRTMEEEAEDFKQQIRHQVCEEIKTKMEKYIEIHKWKYKYAFGHPKIVEIPKFVIIDIISEIEQGESK